MLQALAFISNLFKKENLKLVLFVAAALFLFVFFQTCNNNAKLKEQIKIEKLEQQRIQNNWDASLDTLSQFRDAKGTLEGEIQGYRLTQKELVSKYSELFESVDRFKKEWAKTPPKTIIETKYMIKESIKDFQVGVDQDGQAGSVSFSSDTTFSNGNYRKITGKLNYGLSYFNKSDSNLVNFSSSPLYSKVNPYSPFITIEQKMNLNTGVTKDPASGKVKIWVTTDYPGVTFGEIKGAEIFDPKDQIKLNQKPRKSWGLGFSVGPGLLYDYRNSKIVPGVYMGVGINFSPKKLQF